MAWTGDEQGGYVNTGSDVVDAAEIKKVCKVLSSLPLLLCCGIQVKCIWGDDTAGHWNCICHPVSAFQSNLALSLLTITQSRLTQREPWHRLDKAYTRQACRSNCTRPQRSDTPQSKIAITGGNRIWQQGAADWKAVQDWMLWRDINFIKRYIYSVILRWNLMWVSKVYHRSSDEVKCICEGKVQFSKVMIFLQRRVSVRTQRNIILFIRWGEGRGRLFRVTYNHEVWIDDHIKGTESVSKRSVRAHYVVYDYCEWCDCSQALPSKSVWFHGKMRRHEAYH